MCLLKARGRVSVAGQWRGSFQDFSDDEALCSELRDFLASLGFADEAVFAGVSRGEALTLTTKFPLPAEENMEEIVGLELDRLTPFSRDNAFYGYEIIGRDEANGLIEAFVSVLPKKRFERYEGVINGLSSGIASLELGSTAIVKAVDYLHPGGIKKDSLLICRGRKRLDLVMIAGGSVISARQSSTPEKEPMEALKAEVMSFVDDLSHLGMRPQRVFLCGEVMSEFAPWLSGLHDWKVGSVSMPVPDSGAVAPEDCHVAAFGLALRGIDNDLPKARLLKGSGPRKKDDFSLSPLSTMFVGVVCVLAVLALFVPYVQSRMELKKIDSSLDSLKPVFKRQSVIKEEIAALKKRQGRLQGLGGGHTPLTLLKELTEVLPDNTWLTEFVYKDGGITIGGLTTSSSPLISLLENSPMLKEVKFASSITVTNATSRGRARRGFFELNRGRQDNDAQQLERFKIKALLEKPS